MLSAVFRQGHRRCWPQPSSLKSRTLCSPVRMGDRPCILVIIGATADGRKELVAVSDGVRESAKSWGAVMLNLKSRGQAGDRRRCAGFWEGIDAALPCRASPAVPGAHPHEQRDGVCVFNGPVVYRVDVQPQFQGHDSAMVFKLAWSAEKRRRRIRGYEHFEKVLEGAPSKDGAGDTMLPDAVENLSENLQAKFLTCGRNRVCTFFAAHDG